MFKFSVIFVALLLNSSKVFSAPVNVDNSKTLALNNEYKLNPNGDYFYKYNLDDGQAVDVEGKLKDINGVQAYNVKGSYIFQSDDGKVYTVYYVADENGYRTTKEQPPPPPPSYTQTSFQSSGGFASASYGASAPAAPIRPYDGDEINPKTLQGAFG